MRHVTKLRVIMGSTAYVLPKEVAIVLVDCGKAEYDDENAPPAKKRKSATRVLKSVNDSPLEEVTDG